MQGTIFADEHATVPNVAMGPFDAQADDASTQPILPADGDGIVGLGFQSRFEFALDTKASKLWLFA